MGKAKCELLGLPLPRKMVNEEQYRIPGGTAEVSATIKDLRDAGVVTPTSPFNSHSVCAEDRWIVEDDSG